jgi:opacity protein-like surface antigen
MIAKQQRLVASLCLMISVFFSFSMASADNQSLSFDDLSLKLRADDTDLVQPSSVVRAGLRDDTAGAILIGHKWFSLSPLYGFETDWDDEIYDGGLSISLNFPVLKDMDIRFSAIYVYYQQKREYVDYDVRWVTDRWGWYEIWEPKYVTEKVEVHEVFVDMVAVLKIYGGELFTPYVFAGPSLYYYHSTYESSDYGSDRDDDIEVEFIYGVGLEYRILNNIGLMLEYTSFKQYVAEEGKDYGLTAQMMFRGKGRLGYSLIYKSLGDYEYAGLGLTYFRR